MTARNTLRRNDGPDTSYASADATRAEEYESKAYAVIHNAGIDGCIADDDVRREWDAHPRASYFPRISTLHQKGLILDTGTRRKGDSGRPANLNPCLHTEEIP